MFDAGEFTSNMKVVGKAVSPNGFLGITNSDLAFTGNYVIQGNYNGPVVWDISTPSSPKLVVAYECPASQNDVSVYKNLMFMSAEAQNGRIDCKPGGVREAVSKERMRGVRVFDISNIKEPKLVANVQTCRGSHTHTVLEDPKDRENVYLYVSGSSGIRPSTELEGCAGDLSASDPNSSRLRIEIIKVPLADPSKSAVVGRATVCRTPTRQQRRSRSRRLAPRAPSSRRTRRAARTWWPRRRWCARCSTASRRRVAAARPTALTARRPVRWCRRP